MFFSCTDLLFDYEGPCEFLVPDLSDSLSFHPLPISMVGKWREKKRKWNIALCWGTLVGWAYALMGIVACVLLWEGLAGLCSHGKLVVLLVGYGWLDGRKTYDMGLVTCVW